MNRSRFSVVFCALAVLAIAGCAGPALEIEIKPNSVAMDEVLVDGKQADPAGQNLYRANVQFSNNETSKTVHIRATSRKGVVEEKDFAVEKEDKSPHVTIEMQAQVVWRILPSAERVTLRVNGQDTNPVQPNGLKVPAGRLEIVANNKDTDVDARVVVTTQAGDKVEVELDTRLAALFTVKDKRVKYDETANFDARASTPSGGIQTYRWDFGDGEAVDSQEPAVSHVYRFDAAKWKTEQQFDVTLTVLTANGKSHSQKQPIMVEMPVKALEFDLDVYPDRARLLAGAEVQMKLTPRNVTGPDLVKTMVFDCGDGKSFTQAAGELRLERAGEGCRPLVLTHTFNNVGRFEPRLTYTQPTLGLNEPQAALIYLRGKGAPVLVVTSAYLSDEALKDAAWQDFYRQFKALLQTSKVDKKRLALTSMTSANYEVEEPPFIPVIDRLTRLLAEDDDQFFVLEKTSQVLARLAPEAIVDIRPEFERGDGTSGAGREDPNYRESLDYGLLSDGGLGARALGGRVAQLTYGLKIAGTEDTLQVVDTALGGSAAQGQLAPPRGAALGPAELTDKKTLLAQWLQNMPILMARFRTAEVLVALKVIDEPRVETTGPDRYDEQLREELMTRTASVKVHVRLVERSGRILRAVDITGTHAELVPRGYEPQTTAAH